VTTCDEAREACPLFPGAQRQLHWSFPDPAAVEGPRRTDAFRHVRDGLKASVEELVRRTPA
ncbi:MAG: arsenate reductase ArsC, partial [Chloroflexota bacterium]|nr:arsenate reductase ArsC [Chloroflexota bacterium]